MIYLHLDITSFFSRFGHIWGILTPGSHAPRGNRSFPALRGGPTRRGRRRSYLGCSVRPVQARTRSVEDGIPTRSVGTREMEPIGTRSCRVEREVSFFSRFGHIWGILGRVDHGRFSYEQVLRTRRPPQRGPSRVSHHPAHQTIRKRPVRWSKYFDRHCHSDPVQSFV